MHRRLALIATLLGLAACDPPNCGSDLVLREGRCVCLGVLDPATDECVSSDAGVCDPRGAELCNGVDDDCDEVIDESAASAACGSVNGATAAACTDGRCVVTACASGREDCDDQFGN